MLVAASHRSSGRYNEVLIDIQRLAQQMPAALEAVVFAANCTPGRRGSAVSVLEVRRSRAREVQRSFMAAFGVELPLLAMDLAAGTESPFRVATSSSVESAASGGG